MDLHRTLLKDVILPKVKSVYVVDYYEGVRGLLESREEVPYKSIFANPRFRSRTEIIWSSDVFRSEPQRLCDLNGEEKDYYAYLLYKQLHSIQNLIAALKTEEGGLPLSELLSRVISNIEDRYVYCGEDKIVIVNWGLVPRQADLGGGCIFRSGNFNGNWEKSHNHDPRIKMDMYNSESVSLDTDDIVNNGKESVRDNEPKLNVEYPDNQRVIVSDEPAGNPTVEASDSDNSNILKKDESAKNITEIPEKSLQENHADKNEPVKIKDGNEAKEEKEEAVNAEVKTTSQQSDKEKEKDKDSDKDRDKYKYGWKKFFKETFNGLLFLLKKLWWLLLAILLILLLLFFTRDCQGPMHKINPFYSPLPGKPVIMPVEDDGVVMSEDGLYKVSNNRLNILLEKKGDDTMLEWAKAFKNHYTSSDYEIKYYNEDLYTLQIKVPADKRLEVKNEINKVLDGFSFDCYEEIVYDNNYTPTDPAVDNPIASWYLDVIGAYDAWDKTLGSEDIVVAVVDNGFDLTHPELEGKIIAPYNIVEGNTDIRPIITLEGIDAHGTHVASLAVGNCNNGNGLLGIAPQCRLMPIQVGNDNATGTMSSTAVLEGVLYAINNGADVVNVSVGMLTPGAIKAMSESQQLTYISNSFKMEEELWERVFEKAGERNCIIVLSAGNDNLISGIDPKKRYPHTAIVSAVNLDVAKADFSNYGRYPSLNRDYSTVSAPGVSILSATPGNRYQYFNGTSMAAPIVTGAIALMKSADKNLSADEAIRILQETGTEVDPSIGPVINLAKAMDAVMDNGANNPYVDCDRIKMEVQQLQQQLDSLIRLCPGATEPADTLKFNDAIKDPHGLDGTWKTTTELFSLKDRSPIELFMTFKNLSGTLTLVNSGIEYTAPLQVEINDDKIYITQSAPATSPLVPHNFLPYQYDCSPDRKGNLFCRATSSTNQVEFNLIRVK